MTGLRGHTYYRYRYLIVLEISSFKKLVLQLI